MAVVAWSWPKDDGWFRMTSCLRAARLPGSGLGSVVAAGPHPTASAAISSTAVRFSACWAALAASSSALPQVVILVRM